MSRILIADNNSSERRYFHNLAQMRSILCDEAYDGGKAIELASTYRYDLIMIDTNIPGVGVRGVLNYFADRQPYNIERTIVTSHDVREAIHLFEGLPIIQKLRVLSKNTDSDVIEALIKSYASQARLPIMARS